MTPVAYVHEVVAYETSGPRSWLRTALTFVVGLVTRGSSPANPGGMIISVVHTDTGDELFRHIEDMGDDEGHLLQSIGQDPASMSTDEFATRRGS